MGKWDRQFPEGGFLEKARFVSRLAALGDAMKKPEVKKETAKTFPTIRPALLDRLTSKADRLVTSATSNTVRRAT